MTIKSYLLGIRIKTIKYKVTEYLTTKGILQRQIFKENDGKLFYHELPIKFFRMNDKKPQMLSKETRKKCRDFFWSGHENFYEALLRRPLVQFFLY